MALTINPLHTGGKTKPGPGATINWNHPLAPKTKTGFFLPFNGGGRLPIDLIQNIQWVGQSNAANEIGYYRPMGPPGFHNPVSMRIPNSPTQACYMSPLDVAPPDKDVTLAAIGVNYSVHEDGPRWIGTGDNQGIALEPGHRGDPFFTVLCGGTGHYPTTIPFVLGNWYFFGVSTRNNGNIVDVFVHNYMTSKSYTDSLTVDNWTPPDRYVIGATGSDFNAGSDCDLYWALCDHFYWGFDGMARLAQDPWAFLQTHRHAPISLGLQLETSAIYLGADLYTRGSWIGVYGHEGYYKTGNPDGTPIGETLLPPYVANVSFSNQLYSTWELDSSDGRALLHANGNGRTAATWYNDSPWSVTITVNDDKFHKISLYSCDWEGHDRRTTYTITDADTGEVLSTHSLTSSHNNGIFLQWAFQGNIKITMTSQGEPNSVLSGIFFDEMPLVYNFSGIAEGWARSYYAR